MKKNLLLKMRNLNATKEIIELASADTLTPDGWRTRYEREVYLRCTTQGSLLKVAFFVTEHLKTGSRKPIFELYISKKDKRFITFDRLHDKWLTAKLDRLTWPRYFWQQENTWISPIENKKIKKFLDCQHDGYSAILKYQCKIREDELKQRHKRQTDPWDLDLAQTPALPKDWDRWVDKVGITQNYIFYEYTKRGAKSGYCTFCGKEVPIKNPRYNKEGNCPRCRHKVTYKSVNKAGNVITENECMYLIQRCKDGFIVREFMGHRSYCENDYLNYKTYHHEVRRVIYDKEGRNPRAYYWGDYKQCEFRWITCPPCNWQWSGQHNGKIYGKTLPNLNKNELLKSGWYLFFQKGSKTDPEKHLAIYQEIPILEKIAKANLPKLSKECLSEIFTVKSYISNPSADSLTQALGIDSQKLKRLRKYNGGWRFLEWLQYEKTVKKSIQDDVIQWFCKKEITVQRIGFISDKMTPVQVRNYLVRQSFDQRLKIKDVLITWADYISMAEQLQMDTNDEIVFKVHKLKQRHGELIQRLKEKSIPEQAVGLAKKYPHVNQIYPTLRNLYSYQAKEYSIVVPSGIEEIMIDGSRLNHCAATIERYWERIERHESYILFLRRSGKVDVPYYTLEIEPGGTIRQKRTDYDRQNPDIKAASPFLQEWQKVVSSRLTGKEHKLAKQSRILREQEFVQLRKDQVTIHTGDLRGQLLVDVLVADLMENVA